MSLVKSTLLAGALALGVFSTTAFAGGKGIKVGDALPELNTFGLEGNLPADLKGKVVVLDFWASWCGPCKESFPAMNDLQKKYADKGLVILAVNVDEKAEAMKDFLKQNPASFTIVHDATKKLVGTANISSMPTSFVVGKDGKVAVIHKGFHGKDTIKQYEAEIEKLLSAEAIASK
jgi:thiol-disulfide isomerase/thioredoxin